ncbi:MAG: 50S ribosomal protein L18e [Candidatus Micrarchaeia archaeon]
MKINAENENIKEWLEAIKKEADEKKGIWKNAYARMAVPERRRVSVNLYKINKYTKEGDVVLIPGKVLSIGNMDHAVSIAALSYSSNALSKLKASRCSILGIKDIIKLKNVNLLI